MKKTNIEQKTKKVNLILQSKGGVGKSFLTYLFALKHEDVPEKGFVDLDNSTKTSASQLKFLAEKNRLSVVNISNREHKIDREKLFTVLEEIATLDSFEEMYVDFGAPESEQIPSLLELDFTAEELKEFESETGLSINFYIVIAGGAAYVASMRYLETMVNLLNGLFPITAYINQYTFNSTPELVEEVKLVGKNHNFKSVEFGNIYPDRSSGLEILLNAKNGIALSNFSGFATKTTIKKELEKI